MARGSERVLREETERWPTWVALLVWGACVLPLLLVFLDARATTEAPLAVALLVGTALAVHLIFGRLTIRVTSAAVEARFGWLGWPRKRIPLEKVHSAEVLRYQPLRMFGGWGIRRAWTSRSTRAWTIRGDRALVVHLEDGTTYYLGAAHPERLLAAVDRARS